MEVVKKTEEIKVIKINIQIANTTHYTNTYILIDLTSKKSIVIDPAFDGKYICNILKNMNVELDSIVITHAHADHIGGLSELQELYNDEVKIYIHTLDKAGLTDEKINEQDVVGLRIIGISELNVITVEEGDNISVGTTNLEIIHTPGHTKGSICLYDSKNNILFSGDTIFNNTYGRTDLYWSYKDKMKETLDKLFERFDDIDVFPGHDKVFNLKDSKRKIRLIFAFKE